MLKEGAYKVLQDEDAVRRVTLITGTKALMELGSNALGAGKAGTSTPQTAESTLACNTGRATKNIPPSGDRVGSEAAPGSIEYAPSGDTFLKNAAKRADVDPNGVLDILAHGSSEIIEIGTKELGHRVLAELIRHNPQFKGQTIRLLVCNTGAGNLPLAQNLANKLGVNVIAPNKYIWALDDGTMFVQGAMKQLDGTLIPNPTDPGRLLLFKPGGNK